MLLSLLAKCILQILEYLKNGADLEIQMTSHSVNSSKRMGIEILNHLQMDFIRKIILIQIVNSV